MSVRINLLPHREARRKAQLKHFIILAATTAVVSVVIGFMVWTVFNQQVSDQNERNEFIKKEVAALDKEIEEIKKLKDDISALLARKQVIERLQSDRAQSVHLLEEMVRQVPDGVYLRALKQTGTKVNVVGYAQSNARVSTLMRNVASSPNLENPELIEIKAATVANKRVAEFNMNLSLKRSQSEAEAEAAKAGKAGAAAKKG